MGLTRTVIVLAISIAIASQPSSHISPRQMEKLGRGVVAVNQGDGKVYVGWRLLGTDPDAIAFNLYRIVDNGQPVKLNGPPIADTTNYVDARADLTRSNAYFVRPILNH